MVTVRIILPLTIQSVPDKQNKVMLSLVSDVLFRGWSGPGSGGEGGEYGQRWTDPTSREVEQERRAVVGIAS